jgi:hypothetical protein
MENFYCTQENKDLALSHVDKLVKVYGYGGFNPKYSNVLSKTDYYYTGILAELSFCDFLQSKNINFTHLNNQIKNDTTGDKGDFLLYKNSNLDGLLINLKCQLFYSGEPSEYWNINLNYLDHIDDEKKYIDQYHFCLFNPNTNEFSYCGHINYSAVPFTGKFHKRGDFMFYGRSQKYLWDTYTFKINQLEKEIIK